MRNLENAEREPVRETFERIIGHTPRNKLLCVRYIHEMNQTDPMTGEQLQAACHRQKALFAEYWESVMPILDQAISVGRINRAFIESVAEEMLAGDWTDPVFIESMLKKIEVIDEPNWQEGLTPFL